MKKVSVLLLTVYLLYSLTRGVAARSKCCRIERAKEKGIETPNLHTEYDYDVQIRSIIIQLHYGNIKIQIPFE